MHPAPIVVKSGLVRLSLLVDDQEPDGPLLAVSEAVVHEGEFAGGTANVCTPRNGLFGGAPT